MSLSGDQLSAPAPTDHHIEQVLLGLADGCYVLSTPEGIVAETGVGVGALLGASSEQLAGRPLTDVFASAADPPQRAAFARLLQGDGNAADQPFATEIADGSARSLQFVVVSVPLALGWEFTSLLGELRSRDAETWHPEALRLRHHRALEAVEGVCKTGAQPEPGARLAGILVVVRDADASPLTREDVGQRMAKQRAASLAEAKEVARRAAGLDDRRTTHDVSLHGPVPGLEDLVERAHMLRARVEGAEHEAAAAHAAREQALARLAAVEAERHQESQRREAAEARATTTRETGDGRVEQIAAERDDARASAAAAEAEVIASRAAAAAAHAQVQRAESAADGARAEAQSTRAELEAARTEADGARAEAQSTRAELEAARTDADGARAEAQSARAAADDARADTESARAESEQVRAELQAVRASLQAERASRATAHAEMEVLRTELQEARADADAARVELRARDTQLSAAGAELDAQRAELAEAHEETDALRRELEGVRSELQITRVAAEDVRAEREQARVRANELLGEAERARAAAEAIRAEFAFDLPLPPTAPATTAQPFALGLSIAASTPHATPGQPDGRDRADEPGPQLPPCEPGFAAALIGLDGRFERLDEAFCSLLGCREDELRAARWPSIIDRDNFESHQEIARALRAGEIDSADVDTIYMHAGGLLVPVEGTVALRRDTDGEPTHFLFRADVRRTSGASRV